MIGVDNRGRAVGADVSDRSLNALASRFHSTQIHPNPSCTIERAAQEGRDIIIVRVEPFPVPPTVKVNGVCYVRVGPTTHRAKDVDLTRLQERRPENRRPFDVRACPSAKLDDLSLTKLRDEYLAECGGDVQKDTFPVFEK